MENAMTLSSEKNKSLLMQRMRILFTLTSLLIASMASAAVIFLSSGYRGKHLHVFE